MDHRLFDAAQAGDIEALYNLLQQDPYILSKVDQVPFLETPLHVAISANQTHFAKEIASLQPSFAKKLNQYGNSPLHLASMAGDVEMVQELLTIDQNLRLLKGREKRTPLHCAAMVGKTDVINLLLNGCHKCILELTTRKETALHLAVKNNQLEAFKLLLEWLKKCYEIEIDASALTFAMESVKLVSLGGRVKTNKLLNKDEFHGVMYSHAFDKREAEGFTRIKDGLQKIKKEEVLNWKDDEGNTLLHLATKNKQLEIIKALFGSIPASGTKVEVNAINGYNLTALDILLDLPREKEDQEIENILRRVGAVTANQIIIPPPPPPAATTMSNKTFEIIGRPSPITSKGLLIVAILIALACFLTGLYPPGGVWLEDYKPAGYNNTTTTEHKAGTAIMAKSFISVLFMFANIYCFFASLFTISLLAKGSPLRGLLLFALAALSVAYLLGLAVITPDEKFPSLLIFFLTVLATFTFPLVREARAHCRNKRKGSQATGDEDRVKGRLEQIIHHGAKI
ncbi:hypothetical protein F0562_012835 [Nyssa sinensis]|uniref:PGG domain-containing protein n=1 Tax=Nyssa sinensis TaxID=561372 RepID=A0A5J4ZXM3_9ASTE|nr:hypothetical protein F0562_012835 [Nyssa sinensis]